jgi:hypothetical protein
VQFPGTIVFGPDFSALKFIGCNDWIHGAEARVWPGTVNTETPLAHLQPALGRYGSASASTSAICFGWICLRCLI